MSDAPKPSASQVRSTQGGYYVLFRGTRICKADGSLLVFPDLPSAWAYINERERFGRP